MFHFLLPRFTDLSNVYHKSLCWLSQGFFSTSSYGLIFFLRQLLNVSTSLILSVISKSSLSLCNGNPLPTYVSRMSSCTQYWRTEFCSWVLFSSRSLLHSQVQLSLTLPLRDFFLAQFPQLDKTYNCA